DRHQRRLQGDRRRRAEARARARRGRAPLRHAARGTQLPGNLEHRPQRLHERDLRAGLASGGPRAVLLAERIPGARAPGRRAPGGCRAATSHTGALAGSDAAVNGLFRQSGGIRTDTIEELFDTAMLLGSQPVPTGPGVAILTNAGGPGIMAADACESAGLTL